MTKVLTEDAVIRQLAKAAVDRTVAAAVTKLDEMHDCLSGDDSPLETVWEEICVQVQHEQSFSWDAYDQVVRDLIEGELPNLQDFELTAIWFQTDEGLDWVCTDPEDRDNDVFMNDDVINHIADALYSLAADFERDRIREYLESMYESDD
jgi:hypothetical protein